MRRLPEDRRAGRLVEEAVERFDLDLRGTTVLTEAASGPFVVTPLLAARAGATVIAVTRDSRHGGAVEVAEYTRAWADRLGVADAVEVHVGAGADRAPDADLVTNLGFVRPIDAAFVSRLRSAAAVSLMCEPWEVRPEDVDVTACRAAGIAVLGTDERDPRLRTFDFVGLLALKLLFELEVEALFARVVVFSSEPFLGPIERALRATGAEVTVVDVTAGEAPCDEAVLAACTAADAIVVAEHRDRMTLVGGATGVPLEPLVRQGVVVAHIAGGVEDPDRLLRRMPSSEARPGVLAITTGALGPRPVVDLHAAGLRVGQALVEGVRRLGSAPEAEQAALAESPALLPERSR